MRKNKEVNSYFSNFRCRISSVVVSVSKSTTLTAANGRATSTCRSANPCTASGTRRAPCPTPTLFPLLHLQVRKYSRSLSKTFICSFPFYYFIAQVDGTSAFALLVQLLDIIKIRMIIESMTTSTKLKDQFESTLCNKLIIHFS